MSDEQNPYRFSGDASEEIAKAPEIARRLTLRDLQAIAKGRRLLAMFLAVIGGGCVLWLAALAFAPSSAIHAPPTYLPYH